jgi:hypothetical protein
MDEENVLQFLLQMNTEIMFSVQMEMPGNRCKMSYVFLYLSMRNNNEVIPLHQRW